MLFLSGLDPGEQTVAPAARPRPGGERPRRQGQNCRSHPASLSGADCRGIDVDAHNSLTEFAMRSLPERRRSPHVDLVNDETRRLQWVSHDSKKEEDISS